MPINTGVLVWILVGLILLGLIFFLITRTKKSEHKPNYKAFFILGVIWLPTGVSTKNYALSIVGLTFLIIGLVNKDKWKDENKWSDLSLEQKKIKLSLIILLTGLLIIGIATFIFSKYRTI